MVVVAEWEWEMRGVRRNRWAVRAVLMGEGLRIVV